MPRHNRSIEGLLGGPCKIRKRGCSSSSSSSSLVQNYRFKRAILVGKRGGSSTPVPTWKISSRSPTSVVGIVESPKYQPSHSGGKGKQAPVSARKLAATLWEMNEIPSPRMKDDLEERRIKKEMRARERIARSVQSGSLPPHLSDPSHSPVSERMDRSGTGSLRRRTSAISHRLRLTDHSGGTLDVLSNGSLMEIETRSRGMTPTGSIVGVKTRLKDLSNGLTTSKELLKILNRIWGLEEQSSSSMSLVSALRAELERARLQVDHLLQEQRSDRNEITYLMKRFAEEKAAWKSKEQEKIQAAIESISGNLEVERKLRRRSESLNKKLGRELAETKSSLAKALKELESEKRAREMLEQVCDELARGIGEEKAEVEELRRESAKVREEVEKEREMLQLADVLREERVQMKLTEAKYQFEEKNAAVDKLRHELEALKSRRAKENGIVSQKRRGKVDVGSNLSRAHSDSFQKEDGEVEDGEDAEEEDSAESDLHSIELNMDNNSKSYKWSYATGSIQEDPKRVSVEEEIKGRKSASEKMSRASICLERGISDGIEWDFSTENFQNYGDGIDWARFSEHDRQTPRQDYEDETQRYKSVKGLRDHLLSGSRLASARGFASPTRQWGQPWPSRDSTSSVCEKPTISQESSLKARLVEAKGGEGQTSRRSRG
ncbi:PREDICTED: uncharacterized protein At5g41620 [Nelumbo nucifera]|uniref:Uncharacterized protein At5g41620 n=2 Tax=Nelumbo nucifera TaxID=4432 RepID=A0A1U7ZF92_NELNU|nr:PREDICTED: uncharacterized protein At5g41620 [Nelumbo nucifera]XP_010246156.1 PREDICTED: uncharacterized protein At5g41620 [Nelumbo nucifera]XP_010246161.1 PREDICTED: uncharacterized protein At5g41620 [Nelumbo nucifera]DAD48455.1 TPA_asm: hypothetical protein HUJ06_018392 [Nelumbo nucifera]